MGFTNTLPTAQQHEEARTAVALSLRYDCHTKKPRSLEGKLHQYSQGWLKKKKRLRSKKEKDDVFFSISCHSYLTGSFQTIPSVWDPVKRLTQQMDEETAFLPLFCAHMELRN